MEKRFLDFLRNRVNFMGSKPRTKVFDVKFDSGWIGAFLASTSSNSVRAGTALLSKSDKAWYSQTEAVVDCWPLIGEPDQVVGPIVPIHRKRIGRFGYRALVMGRTPCLDFGSYFGQGFSVPKGMKQHVPFDRLFRHLVLARNQP